MLSLILAVSPLSCILSDHVGCNCGLLKRLKVSFDNPPCLSCRRGAYEWLLQVQTPRGAKTVPGWPSGVKSQIQSLWSFLFYSSLGSSVFFSFHFSVHVYTLSLSPLRSGGELFCTSGKLRPGIVHYNQRFPGRVVRGTLSIIARAHEGFVQSVKTILLYRSDIFRQTKISFSFYFLLCGA